MKTSPTKTRARRTTKPAKAPTSPRAKIRPGLIVYHWELNRPVIILRVQEQSAIYMDVDGEIDTWSSLSKDFDCFVPAAGSPYDMIADDVAAALARHGYLTLAAPAQASELCAAITRAGNAIGEAMRAVMHLQDVLPESDDRQDKVGNAFTELSSLFDSLALILVHKVSDDIQSTDNPHDIIGQLRSPPLGRENLESVAFLDVRRFHALASEITSRVELASTGPDRKFIPLHLDGKRITSFEPAKVDMSAFMNAVSQLQFNADIWLAEGTTELVQQKVCVNAGLKADGEPHSADQIRKARAAREVFTAAGKGGAGKAVADEG